jgi:acyl-CoA thioester hydrolase
MTRGQLRFFHRLRVRYAEVDSQGIVFNAHYLTYFDTAITEYVREIHSDYYALVLERGLDFHLVKSTVEYLKPIGYDELIDIGVEAGKIGKSSITWKLGVFKMEEDACAAKGEIVWVCYQVATGKSHPLPEDLVKTLSEREKAIFG